ncbi:helix-turn-helix transcriptional regulator [Paenibacillus macerans]|uniref:helix-turn-helix domain-containing protein n=1 Tax=Paenibacillus macerans TaxID=44252 RepID=UPI002DBD0E42|nr:helix-turn-helix transcriptional regulator [Paenibacillus macerans]MEC0329876.1 helix-turn-helix transcriptional regulator [Paenibacillus macerans]
MAQLRNFLGNRIRAIRNAKGLTQQNLADISGLDYRYIGAIERGERNFSIDNLEKVLVALNVSLHEVAYLSVEQGKVETARWEAIDYFIASTERLSEEQIEILRRVNQEVVKAFK